MDLLVYESVTIEFVYTEVVSNQKGSYAYSTSKFYAHTKSIGYFSWRSLLERSRMLHTHDTANLGATLKE